MVFVVDKNPLQRSERLSDGNRNVNDAATLNRDLHSFPQLEIFVGTFYFLEKRVEYGSSRERH
jgi:hypothetical protein